MSASTNRKLKQAQELLQSGNLMAAQRLCEEVVERAPRNPEALCLLGIARLAAGDARQALPLLERAASGHAGYGLALEHLGLAYLMLDRFADAERALRDAAALPGAPASVRMRLGIALLNQDRPREALAVLQEALALAPEDPDCHLNLAHAYARQSDIAAARNHLETVLRLNPAHVEACFNLGVLALQGEELDTARQWFERTLERAPQYVDALVNLGVVLQRQSLAEDATRCFRRALEIAPGHAVANKNLADTLASQGRPEEALDHYLAALKSAENFVAAREGLAGALLALGRFREAIASLQEVLRLDPGHPQAWGVLADALFQCGELADAEPAARRAREIDPGLARPYSVLALVHIVRGELDHAIATLEEGFERTGSGGLLGMLAHQLRRVCDWEKRRAVWAELKRRLGQEADLGSPFWLLIEDTTPEEQLDYTRRWAEAQFGTDARAGAGRVAKAVPAAGRRVRIGYLSSEFHEHAIAYLFAGVLERHDRTRFETFAYSYGPEDESAMRARLRAGAEHFVEVAWDPDDVVMRRIQDDALDILVDLKGYTMGARTSILARRPCPVQVNWLGYPGTLGASFIDHLITDRFIVPQGSESAYSEKIAYLDHCWQCNDRSRPLLEPLTRAEYGLPADAFVFCCFAQSAKISPEIFARWMKLLHDVPGSVLWLAADNQWASANLKRAAQAQGVAPERLVFSPRIPFAQHLARYRVADLALDTFPYTSHSTASDALWAGCPVVALCGNTFAARVSGSILTHADLPELITGSLDDYGQLARRLATDAGQLAEIRSKVSTARSSSLFDADAFARDLERVYLNIVIDRA
ncbi:MAG: tetratricopeptide repeat protein [Betaproteobacteria bacterium]|nr:tetratricopeptide repeat protein [Betaproteobacteria bacterium]